MSAKKKVVFRAPVLTYSGYGVHARQVARYLIDLADKDAIDLYIEPTRWGNTPWALNNSLFDGQVERIVKYVRPTTVNGRRLTFDVAISLLLPNEWLHESNAVNIGMSACVEADRANPKWVDACNLMDIVIVPSTHAKRSLHATGKITTPIHVVPEAYIDSLDKDVSGLWKKFQFETSFNFLVVGQLTSNSPALDRKNVFGTVEALCSAFGNDKDVGIVLKTNSGRGTKIDRKATLEKLKRVLRVVRRGEYPRVHLIHGEMSDDEMAALYTHPSMKAFVTLTRGEGFGLPILEAAVAGLPVIATDWSGHLDFLSLGKFIRIGYDLRPIPAAKVDRHEDVSRNIWIEGAQWAQPKSAHVKRALAKFRVSPNIPTQWAVDLAKTLRMNYSYDAIKKQYDVVLGPVLCDNKA